MISIPESVTTINNGAFQECSALKSLFIPRDVNHLKGVFTGCCGLAHISVDPNNLYYQSRNNCLLSKDGIELIIGCNNSKIPETVLKICEVAFWRCSGLTSIEIPRNVVEIEKFAFNACTSIKSIHIPSSVSKIGRRAFSRCAGLKSITVESDNKSYGSNNNCLLSADGGKLIMSILNSVIPDGVVTICEGAF